MRPSSPPASQYLSGFELFNAGHVFEAHEDWEALWLREPRGHPNRLFLQGLIQIAAAFHRVRTGFPGAAYRLFRSARRKLAPYAPSYKGVRVASLLPLLERWQDRTRALAAGSPAPAAEPFRIEVEGSGWEGPALAHDGSRETLALARAFEQYSSDRRVTAACPRCGEPLAVNGRHRAPAVDREEAWRVACPRGCVARDYRGQSA